jgi:hypothetical protein
MTEIIATCRALRTFARGKPLDVHDAALNAVTCLRRIARGFGGPKVHAVLAENIERLGRK